MLRSQPDAVVDVSLGAVLPNCLQIGTRVKHRALLRATQERYEAERPDKQEYPWGQR